VAEQVQADLAEAKVKVAKEQDAAIAKALQEDDEARRQADLKEVAAKEAEAPPLCQQRRPVFEVS
jgi:hypothetical protein